MNRVGVIGHFGFGLDLANGQTIKTKIVTEEVERFCGETALKVDTHGGIKAVIPVAIKSIIMLSKCKNVIIMLTENGLKVVVPILSVFNLLFHRRLHYVVVGGWLPSLLKKSNLLRKKLRKFHKLYVETRHMRDALEQIGLFNVCVMPNCKHLNIVNEVCETEKPYRVCTFSRVMKEKGIEEAAEAVKNANHILKTEAYCLDIYGQIDERQKEWFRGLMSSCPRYIEYKGVVQYNQSTEVLKRYFALLFPTFYEGEGFAGTAIDAFSAGVPVIASDWKYNAEVVIDGSNGFIFETHNIDQLTDILISAYMSPEKIIRMKLQCLETAKKFSPELVLKTLFNELV